MMVRFVLSIICVSQVACLTVCAQTTKQLTATNGDGWYRIIESTSTSGAGMVKVWGITGSNRQTNITMFVSLMRYGQGGVINIVNNMYYNTNHIDEIRGGSVNDQTYVLDIHIIGANYPASIWVETDGNLAILDVPIFNPTAPTGNIIETSGRVIGATTTAYPGNFGKKVGIGTTTPSNLLEVKSSLASTNPAFESENDQGTSSYFYTGRSGNSGLVNKTIIENASGNDILLNPTGGNVGIGTVNPERKVEVYGNDPILKLKHSLDGTGAYGWVEFSDINSRMGWIGYGSSGNTHMYITQQSNSDLIFNTNNTERMRVLANGNVGIGTTTPDNKLDVKGTIRAEEVKVETGWADYVFNADYKLRSLSEVSTYIEENHHLPGIPTAEEVAENGINLGEMNAKLLEKVEELTLYLIEMKEENEQQQKEIEILKSKVK